MFYKNFRIFNMKLLISKSFFKPYFIQSLSVHIHPRKLYVNHIAEALLRSPSFDPKPEEEQDILACQVVVARKVGGADGMRLAARTGPLQRSMAKMHHVLKNYQAEEG